MTWVVSVALVLLAGVLAQVDTCYWNAESPYLLFSTKTPYDTFRGDIRDYPVPQNCKAVSIWGLIRHGNRNPKVQLRESIQYVVSLKDEIIASYNAGRSQLCAQDVQNFRKWSWNETRLEFPSSITSTGYKEMYDFASRLREKYPHLLRGTESDYYFRPANAQRTIDSAVVFVQALTEGTNLTLTPDSARQKDDIVKIYDHCDRYLRLMKASPVLSDQMEAYYNTTEFIAVHKAVQQRLGISTQLTVDNLETLYEMCRFDRSWSEALRSPWCAAFSNHDLEVLEYKDDIKRYYWNGYGFSMNAKLGGPTLRDLYENFEASINRKGKKIVSYITHDTTLEMVYSTMGLFKDAEYQVSYRNPNRLWKSSITSGFLANFIAVLNSCEAAGSQEYRVQFFINEKETELCPLEGCTWQQFKDKFEVFKSADLEFCREFQSEPKGNSLS